MVKGILSIALSINIVLCSIGVQVLKHHCVWCGGDRLEIVSGNGKPHEEGGCCSKQVAHTHDCRKQGCCKSELLKLAGGTTSEDGFTLKKAAERPEQVIAVICLGNSGILPHKYVLNYWTSRGSPPLSAKSGFLVPLRC